MSTAAEMAISTNAETAPTTEILRVARELRAYDPEADPYRGKFIHKLWARELEMAIEKATKP